MLLITGTLRSTATDTADTLANLIPFHLLIDKLQYNAALWLAMLPPTHPLHKHIKNTASRLVKCHPTPLHDLMHRYNLQPSKIKKIQAFRHHPKWKLAFTTSVITDIDKAVNAVDQDNSDINVFTDGSGMNGKISASAVLYRNDRQKASVHFCLGPSKYHTGFEGKATSAILATKLSSKEGNFRTVSIFIDSHVFIAASRLSKPTPSHYLTDIFHKNITNHQR